MSLETLPEAESRNSVAYRLAVWRRAWMEALHPQSALGPFPRQHGAPFVIKGARFSRMSRSIGGKQNNFNEMRGVPTPDNCDLVHLEKLRAGEAGRIRGERRFCLPHPDPLWQARMGDEFPQWERSKRSGESRRRLDRKRRALSRDHGGANVLEARTPDEIDRILAAFLDQRARMAAIGRIPNPFADPRRQTFLREAAKSSLGGREGFRLHALEAGGRIVATHGALFSGDYMSGYMTSMDEDFARYSPGKILQREVLRLAHEEGVREFDLGLGDDAYKAEWAERVDLYDVLVPLTWKGYVAALVIAARLRVLYVLKRTGWGRKLLKRARFALDRLLYRSIA